MKGKENSCISKFIFNRQIVNLLCVAIIFFVSSCSTPAESQPDIPTSSDTPAPITTFDPISGNSSKLTLTDIHDTMPPPTINALSIFKDSSSDLLSLFIGSLILTMAAQGFYSIRKSSRLAKLLKCPGKPLEKSEQTRLDNLLSSGKRFHNWGFVFSAALLGLSALDEFKEFIFPTGQIIVPVIQTSVFIYFLVLISLMVTDRFFYMAYPWLLLDTRRPPYDWLLLGLRIDKKYMVGLWFYVPLLISSIGLSTILVNESVYGPTFSYITILLAGWVLVHFPRGVKFYSYLISERLDHRGGLATLSIFFLYHYRLIRLFAFSFLMLSPFIYAIPNWRTEAIEKFITILLIIYGFIWILRSIAGFKIVYHWIDRKGKKFNFPTKSSHYK